MAPRTIQLFVTPQASARVRRRAQALVRELEQRGAMVLQTRAARHPLTIDDRADHVCTVGGDGTLRYAVDAVRRLDRPVSISIFPAGTINLIARELVCPKSPAAFADRLMRGEARPLYAALFGDLPLLACGSVGPDSFAVARVSLGLKRLIGRAAYGIAFLGVLVRWPRVAIDVWADDEHLQCQALYIAKGHFYAGPWTFAPDASLGEPTLHIVALADARRGAFFRFVWQLFLNRPIDRLKGVRTLACTTLRIDANMPTPLQSDGDIVGDLPATITIDPVPLQIL